MPLINGFFFARGQRWIRAFAPPGRAKVELNFNKTKSFRRIACGRAASRPMLVFTKASFEICRAPNMEVA